MTESANLKRIWKTIYILAFLFGGMGLLAVNLNLLVDTEVDFDSTQVTKFHILVIFGFIVRFLIYPRN